MKLRYGKGAKLSEDRLKILANIKIKELMYQHNDDKKKSSIRNGN
jgi:hypothetical protein